MTKAIKEVGWFLGPVAICGGLLIAWMAWQAFGTVEGAVDKTRVGLAALVAVTAILGGIKLIIDALKPIAERVKNALSHRVATRLRRP